jgi:hypothetical protein
VSSCRVTRKNLLEVVRGTASEAVRLEVESHLEDCESCSVERGRWGLVGLLREQPTPTLSAGAQKRVLTRLLESRVGEGSRMRSVVDSSRRRAVLAACVAGGLAAATLTFAIVGRERGETLTETKRIEASAPGTVSFGGARIAYEDGAQLLADPPRRRLALVSGQVDVDVDAKAGLPGRFRVVTDRFIVEVLGTRFIVTPRSVRTLRGRVHVLDLQEHELALLVAGESWTVPEPTAAPPVAPSAPASASPPPAEAAAPSSVPAPAPVPVARVQPASAQPPSVEQLLARGRAATSEGDVPAARAWLARARASKPNEAESAALDLLEADAWLVAKQNDDAIAAYRRVATRWLGRPEAETASFAVGQLLAEGDSVLAAETALTEYLAHYPHGRFVREAREQLAQLQSSK